MDSTAGPSELVLEEDTSKSLAATLALARAKGYVDKHNDKRHSNEKTSNTKKVKSESPYTLVEEKREDNHRGRDYRSHHRGARGSQLREVKEREYKPEIKLEYTDEAGRKLEKPKEAFNHMCYAFHGRRPGKNKIDKRLRKLEMESKMKEAMATDVPSSTTLMISKQKELKTPFIILSKGK